MLVMFFFFLFFISPRVLKGPSADRPETWPHGRKLSEFYNPSPKIRGPSPKKIWGQKHAKFRSIFTAQCTLVHMRGLGIACRPSVRPSVRLSVRPSVRL